jgi:hypothetical protein
VNLSAGTSAVLGTQTLLCAENCQVLLAPSSRAGDLKTLLLPQLSGTLGPAHWDERDLPSTMAAKYPDHDYQGV